MSPIHATITGMRAVTSLAAAAALCGVAGAGEHAGHAVRVDPPPRREVFVPAGTFVMGIDDDGIDWLKNECKIAFEQRNQQQIPTTSGGITFCELYEKELDAMADHIALDDGTTVPRKVYLSAFAIDRDEVSVADYRACIAAGSCSMDPMIAGDERYIVDGWPIVNVTWGEAQTFCRWRGGRLPTEAEWERAARGDDRRPWPWGVANREGDFNHGQERAPAMREMDRLAWIQIPMQFLGDTDGSDGAVYMAPPGSYPWGAGPYGTRDQAGNVAEWTADVHGGTLPNFTFIDATLGYKDLSSINPRRDGTPTEARVVRGGSWRQPTFLARANVRDPFNMMYDPDGRFSHIGFRCARGN